MSDLVWVALITAGGPLIGLWIKDVLDKKRDKKTKEKLDEYHKQVNGMKTELVEAVRGEAGAKGEIKGAADNQAVTDAKPQEKK